MKWIAFLLVASFSCAQKPVAIRPLTMLTYVDSSVSNSQKIYFKADYFLVEGYKDNPRTYHSIDSFVKQFFPLNANKFNDYKIIFYKASKETNVENIRRNQKVIDRYSNEHDRVFEYFFSNGKFKWKWRIKNGEIIEPKSDIIVEDIQNN